MRIMIIEDNHADVRLFKEALKFSGITAEVTHMEDGITAIDSLQSDQVPWKQHPHIIFLDLNMPFADGFEVLKAIRASHHHGKLRVVIFTSSQRPSDMERAMELQADYFIQKPSDVFEFFEVVKTTIRDCGANE